MISAGGFAWQSPAFFYGKLFHNVPIKVRNVMFSNHPMEGFYNDFI